MFNEGIDRGSNVPKIMGVLCALAAVLDVAGIFFGGGFSCIIYAVANGLLAFICFAENDNEKAITLASVGAIILAEVIGGISVLGSSTAVINSLVSIIGHGAIFLYILANRISRNNAMLAGALIALDAVWDAWIAVKAFRMLQYTANMLGGSGLSESVYLSICMLAAVSITAALPAMAITIMLFSGSMDYGK